MRKFPKLLAIVLAIAIVICPAMCLTTMAASTATYDLAYEDGVLTVTVSAESGFLVSLLRIDVEGFAIDDEKGIAVATKEGRAFSANPAYDDVAGILSLVIAPKEPLDITTVTEATVTIEATELDVAERYYIALTKIQVADAGTAEDPESLLDIAGVAADGTVETVVPTVNRLPHVCEVVAEYVDNGDGTHNGLCKCGEVLIENEDHSDENADNACDKCDAELEAPHTHEYLTYKYVDINTHTVYCDCENEETVNHAYDEDGVCPCGANEPKEVPKGFVFGEVSYDAATNALSVKTIGTPEDDLQAANTAARGDDRVRGLKVVVGGSEYFFESTFLLGANTFKISGLAFTDMSQDIEISYVVSSVSKGVDYESDAFKVNVFELLEGVKRRDAKVAQMLDVYEASKTAPIISMEAKAASETKGFVYGDISYDAANCTLIIKTVGTPDEELQAANTAARGDDRVRGIKLIVGDAEYFFESTFLLGANTFKISGLALTDITEDITFSYTISSVNNSVDYESGSVTVDIATVIANSEGAFADAYNAFVG